MVGVGGGRGVPRGGVPGCEIPLVAELHRRHPTSFALLAPCELRNASSSISLLAMTILRLDLATLSWTSSSATDLYAEVR